MNNSKPISRSLNLNNNAKPFSKRRHSHQGVYTPSLLLISEDVLWRIIKELSLVDAVHLRLTCKKLNELTEMLGKHLLWKFVRENNITLDDACSDFTLYYQQARSPFKDVMYLGHVNRWWKLIEYMYKQYKYPTYCFNCNYNGQAKLNIQTQGIHNTSIDMHVIPNWKITLCSMCYLNGLISYKTLEKRYSDKKLLRHLVKDLEPINCNGKLVYFKPSFDFLLIHSPFKMTKNKIKTRDALVYFQSKHQSMSISEVPSISLYFQPPFMSSVASNSLFNKIDHLLPTQFAQFYHTHIFKLLSPIASSSSNIEPNPSQFDPEFDELCLINQVNPLSLIPTHIQDILADDELLSAESNELYMQLCQFQSIYSSLNINYNLICFNDTYLCKELCHIIVTIINSSMGHQSLLEFVQFHSKLYEMFPGLVLSYDAKRYISNCDSQSLLSLMQLLFERKQKIPSNMPIADPCIAPNFKLSLHLPISLLAMHWVYDIENGGDEKDLKFIINRFEFCNQQKQRQLEINQLLQIESMIHWVKIEYPNNYKVLVIHLAYY